MALTVLGFFENTSDAYNAVDMLTSKGFDNSNIDVSENYESYENAEYRKERSGKAGNFFRSLFTNEDQADKFTKAAGNNTMVTVHTMNQAEAEKAAVILDDCGAIDVDEKYYSEDTMVDTDKDDYSEDTMVNTDKDYDRTSETSIPIIEEDVNIGKRQVKRGEVRVRSRIIARPVEETLRLREERVHIERTPVNREASEADLQNFKEDTIQINEYGEEVIVSKKTRVVEEVNVRKDVEERNETVRETERKTEVDVDKLDDSKKDYK
jgi:uncharacterized protein (TIGR02271 family)